MSDHQYLYSIYFESTDNGEFKGAPLPFVAQFALLFKILSSDINDDAKPDIIAGDNHYAWDSGNDIGAPYEKVLIGDVKGTFNVCLSPGYFNFSQAGGDLPTGQAGHYLENPLPVDISHAGTAANPYQRLLCLKLIL